VPRCAVHSPSGGARSWCGVCGLTGRGLAATFRVLGPEAGDIKLQQHGMMDQAIDRRRRRHLIAEDAIPLREDQIARDEDGSSLIAFGEQRKENLRLSFAKTASAFYLREKYGPGSDARAYSLMTLRSTSARVGDPRIRHAIEALDRRYAEPRLALGDIALAANLSLCHATRLLKRQTGLGFVAHLHQRRIAAARVYLTETTVSIKEIADRLGYKSASEFGRHFRRSSYMTPRDYRGALAFTGTAPRAKSH
jgi:AraC-like DNA-binding protein